MEWNDRIAAVRKAAGLTQEQLGELVGVTRQAVSKWEAAQAVPDALTVARLCEALHVSADYILLGREPEEDAIQPEAYTPPDTCPCCGREVNGRVCAVCGYQLPDHPPRGRRYALVASSQAFSHTDAYAAALVKYCGFSQEYAESLASQMDQYGTLTLLRRGLFDEEALYLASHLQSSSFYLTIVADDGEDNNDELCTKPSAMELPPPAKGHDGIGFWGVVGAVIVALLILSFF